MKVVIAIDSFKGSLSSVEAGKAVSEGIHRADEKIVSIISPIADGGEGTVEALVSRRNGHMEYVEVTGPLYNTIGCSYGILEDGKTAVLEMAAAGLDLVPKEQRNPLNTTQPMALVKSSQMRLQRVAGDLSWELEGVLLMMAALGCYKR